MVTTLHRLVGGWSLARWYRLVLQLEHDDTPVSISTGLSYPEVRVVAHELLRLGATPAVSVDAE